MMRMLMEMVLGFLVLQAAASPRFARQVELDTYDSANYDVDLENLNPENQDIYDYEDGLTIDEPQIEIGTLAPPDYNYPAPGASLEEEEEEEQEEGLEEEEQEEDQEEGQEEEQEEGQEEEEQEEGQEEEQEEGQEEEELEEAQEEEELEEAQEEEELEEGQEEEEEQEEEQEIQLKVEEEVQLKPKLIPQGSGDSGILMGPDTQKEEELRLAPIDILHVSGDFGGSVGSGASGESGSSGDLLGSGDLLSSGDLLGSGGSGGSGDLGSGGSGASGASGDILGSGESGDILGSGGSGITMISGEEELILEKIPQEASGDEESGASGDPSASGEAGEPSASGEEGEPSASGEEGEPSASGEDVSGVSAESGVSGEEGEPIIPIIDKEEELLPATPSPEETEGEIISGASGLEPDTEGMPTCLLCTCLGGSVYCDDLKLSHVPPLPKDTTHFYARYNKITKINKSDFAEMNKLKRIDVTANEISSVADGAFTGLPVLEELIIRENAVAQLPALPVTMTLVDASHNNIGATGIHKEAFKDMAGLLYLYLTDNHIDHIPVPLPDSLRSLHLQRNNIQMMHEDTFCNLKDFNYIRNALEDIRLDGNPLNLSRTPQAYVCLPRVPVGDLI